MGRARATPLAGARNKGLQRRAQVGATKKGTLNIVAAQAATSLGLVFLEARSVRTPTLLDYQRRMERITHWLFEEGRMVVAHAELERHVLLVAKKGLETTVSRASHEVLHASLGKAGCSPTAFSSPSSEGLGANVAAAAETQ